MENTFIVYDQTKECIIIDPGCYSIEEKEELLSFININQLKPTLLINAKDDTFLSKECFPFKEAYDSDNFFFESTNYGGHVGFMSSFKPKENTWLELRIERFIKENIQINLL